MPLGPTIGYRIEGETEPLRHSDHLHGDGHANAETLSAGLCFGRVNRQSPVAPGAQPRQLAL